MQPTFFNFRVNKCDHCLFSTNSKDVLSNHIKRVHDGIASHICHLCSVACWYVEHKDYILSSLSNKRGVMLTNFRKFHPARI